MLKLTVYVPESHLEELKDSLFAAGAGRYDGYDSCCWQVQGTGQFRPLEGSQPHLGIHGQIEKVTEFRLEMILDDASEDAVRDALKRAHPYEVPAFDFVSIKV